MQLLPNLVPACKCPVRSVGLAVLACSALTSVGCARQLSISVDRFINNAPHLASGRNPDQCTGFPLQVDIVCVYPEDLEHDINDQLAGDSGITTDIWYENRPQVGDKVEDEQGAHFRIPAKQIYVFTDEGNVYGKKIGSALTGKEFGKAEYEATFSFGGDLHSSRSAIYVFPRFDSPDGGVLSVKPAVFHPPGAYIDKISVRIGVDDSRGSNYGQYIDVTSPRKMHGKNDE